MRSSISLALIAVASLAQASPLNERNNGGQNEEQKGSQPSVKIQNGTILGVDIPGFDQEAFFGIPYAKPPVGDLRLKPAQPRDTPFGSYQATDPGAACYSPLAAQGMDFNAAWNQSEDCLTLNIVRPYSAKDQSKPLPVAVWIYGGAFTQGFAGDQRYNGTWLLDAGNANGSPFVYVSINYRLASLGFSYNKALLEEGSVNLGIRDQYLALQWVQENIAAFGGDPDRVTLFGESAGGASTLFQTLAYGGRDDNHFHQVIIQSGTLPQQYANVSSPAAVAAYNNLLANSTCISTMSDSAAQQLACIRSLPIQTFRQLTATAPTGFVQDNDFLQSPSSASALNNGAYIKVPSILGANTDEGSTFGPRGANSSEDVLRLNNIPESIANATLAAYSNDPKLGCPYNTGDYQLPPTFGPPGTQDKRSQSIYGDIFVDSGRRHLAQLNADAGVPVYSYRFNHVPWVTVSLPFVQWVSHGSDVPYVFNSQVNRTEEWLKYNLPMTPLGQGAPIADRALGEYMARSWAAFIATGNPNDANYTSGVYWPEYSNGTQNLVWQTQGSIVEKDDYRKEGIQTIIEGFWSS